MRRQHEGDDGQKRRDFVDEDDRHTVTAPMPATVHQVPVKPGDAVRKGDLVVLLEAMKMELPLRATGDAIVATVYCRVGELVEADSPLVELR